VSRIVIQLLLNSQSDIEMHQDLPYAPLIVGLEGLALTDHETVLLTEPAIGGVILFARNYVSVEQLTTLCAEIKKVNPGLIVSVDQEGGRVQRFLEGFTQLQPLRVFGKAYDDNPAEGLKAARVGGKLMAQELVACGVDLSFAPVVDIDHGISDIIGERAFHASPKIVTALARAFIQGMKQAGMASVIKHYPGHGAVSVDTHKGVAIDNRALADIENSDLIPFMGLATVAEGVMASHVVFPEVDDAPCGFSSVWLQDVLRQQHGFKGLIVSDDIGMAASAACGSAADVVARALAAGCDAVLLCNELNIIAPIAKSLKGAYQALRPLQQTAKMSIKL
jgi:beta-N-acetylhexosaminidase